MMNKNIPYKRGDTQRRAGKWLCVHDHPNRAAVRSVMKHRNPKTRESRIASAKRHIFEWLQKLRLQAK